MGAVASPPMTQGGTPVDEEARRRLEADRIAGGSTPIGSFAPPRGSPAFAATVEELIAIDLEFRWQARRADPTRPAPDPGDYAELLAACGDTAIAERIGAENEMLRSRSELPPELRPGARLGHHVLRELAGRGAFAEVWRAWDESLLREVAVKVPRPGADADPDGDVDGGIAGARFLREAKSAARLRHPGIVTVHEVGESPGRRFIVSDFIPGGTLAERLQRGPVTPDAAARIALSLAEALDYAHQFGVVHRDVKPGNVLLDADGRPLLADFGLAALRSADTALTREGDVLGTPGYMAPEQISGAPGPPDPRTDVYGAGAVLYALLTGVAPFPGRTVERVLYAVVHEDPAAPSSRTPGVPRDLERICVKAMSRDPADRYATARALAEDLRRFLAREPVVASAPSILRRATLWARREPRVAATIACGALGIAVAIGVGVVGIDAERRRTKSHLYRALVSEAEALAASRGTDWLSRARKSVGDASACDVPERDARALRDLILLCHGSAHASISRVAEWDAGPGAPLRVAVSDGAMPNVAVPNDAMPNDARLCAGVTTAGRVWVRRVPSGEVVAVSDPSLGADVGAAGTVAAVAFAAGGRVLVLAFTDGSVAAADPATLRLISRPTPAGVGAPVAIACAPTHTSRAAEDASAAGVGVVATAWSDGSIAILADGGNGGGGGGGPRVVRTVRGAHSGAATALAFSGDGRRLVSAGEDRRLRLWDVADLAPIASVETSDPPRSVACDDAGTYIAWCAWETAGWGWWRPGATVPAGGSPGVHRAAVRWVGLDRDGRVSTLSADATLRVWGHSGAPLGSAGPASSPYLTGASGRGTAETVAVRNDGRIDVWRSELAEGRAFFGTRHTARFLPGAPRIATCAGVLDVDSAGRISGAESALADAAQVWDVAVSADGRHLATAAHDGAVRLRDPATFAVVRTLRESGPLAWSVSFDPAGERLAACCGDDVVLWSVQGSAGAGPAGVLAGHRAAVSAVVFDPTRARIYTAAADGEVRVWDAATLACAGVLFDAPAALRGLALSPDGACLAAACDDGTVLVWRESLARESLPSAPDRVLDAGAGAVWAVAFDPETRILAAGTERGAVTLFSAGDGTSLATLRGDFGRVRSLSFDGTGRRLAAGCYVGASILWDLPVLRATLRNAGVDWADSAPPPGR